MALRLDSEKWPLGKTSLVWTQTPQLTGSAVAKISSTPRQSNMAATPPSSSIYLWDSTEKSVFFYLCIIDYHLFSKLQRFSQPFLLVKPPRFQSKQNMSMINSKIPFFFMVMGDFMGNSMVNHYSPSLPVRQVAPSPVASSTCPWPGDESPVFHSSPVIPCQLHRQPVTTSSQ